MYFCKKKQNTIVFNILKKSFFTGASMTLVLATSKGFVTAAATPPKNKTNKTNFTRTSLLLLSFFSFFFN